MARPGKVAARAAQGLAERAHPKIAVPRIDPITLADAAPAAAQHAQRMRLVDIQQRLATPLDGDELRQVRVVAVHAVHAFQGDHRPAIIPADIVQEAIHEGKVVVREGAELGLRGLGAVDDALMGQLVVEDQVLEAEEMAQHRCIRAVAAGKHGRRFRADEAGDFLIQFPQDGGVAPDEAACRRAGPEPFQGRPGGGDDRRGAGHAQIVEARITDDLAAGHGRAGPRPPA